MIRYLIQKEFLQIRRNAFLPRLILVFPIVIMCVMPWVMNQEVKNIRVSVVDNDHSTLSRQLVQSIEHSNYFIFTGMQPSYQAALQQIEKSQTDIVLVIPPKSEELRMKNEESLGSEELRMKSEESAGALATESPVALANSSLFTLHSSLNNSLHSSLPVLIAANAVNGTKGGIGAAYLAQIVTAQMASGAQVGARGQTNGAAQAGSTLYLYNKHLNYKVFMIPALLAIVMMLMCGFLPALNIVGEKETGTIEQINVTPVSKWAFILAKLIPYWLIALFIVSVCLLLAWAVYGITCQGPLWLVYVLAMLLALFFSSFGLLISNFSDTLQQAIFVMWFFVVCLMLLSGLFTPTRSMPDWSYATTYVNPMHYFIDAVRTVFVRGGGFASVAHQVAALAAFALGMGACAVASYKKNA